MTHQSTTSEPEIRELYRVFQPYQLGDDFSGCECCVSQTDCERLAAISLDLLSISDLDRYAFKAMTTWGTERHFKHFLPRLLELAFHDYLSFDWPETLLGKLAYAKWIKWPAPERDAVRNFLESFWLHQLRSEGRFPNDERIRSTLGGLAEANDSIEAYLHLWARQRHPLPALHLAQLIDDTADEIMTKGRVTLWRNTGHQCGELMEWLASDEPRTLIDEFSAIVETTFPMVRGQLEGIAAARDTQ